MYTAIFLIWKFSKDGNNVTYVKGSNTLWVLNRIIELNRNLIHLAVSIMFKFFKITSVTTTKGHKHSAQNTSETNMKLEINLYYALS